MTKKEILLKQRNAENAPLTNYIGTDGYVWKMIENAMEEYAQQVKSVDLADVVGRSEQCAHETSKISDDGKYWVCADCNEQQSD